AIRLLMPILWAFAFASDARAEEDEAWMRLRPVVGEETAHLVEPGQTIHDVAYLHRLGFEAIQRLNPEVDPWIPPPGTIVRLPTRFVLPAADPEGLVINLPEMRLYDFTGAGPVRVHAVAVGDAEDPTPIREFRIGAKSVDPIWAVPESIRQEKPYLSKQVQPGEDNPLGSRWMTLGTSSYGIHGTNVRWSIGRGSTHGCVRLYEDVMQALFERVERGTPVSLIYEPYKWGTNGKKLFVEVHPDIYDRLPDTLAAALSLPRELGLLKHVDVERVWSAVERADGIPVEVGALP
ncbi:MAG: L,D-transpeptidase family protein, partial [bacterium]